MSTVRFNFSCCSRSPSHAEPTPKASLSGTRRATGGATFLLIRRPCKATRLTSASCANRRCQLHWSLVEPSVNLYSAVAPICDNLCRMSSAPERSEFDRTMVKPGCCLMIATGKGFWATLPRSCFHAASGRDIEYQAN